MRSLGGFLIGVLLLWLPTAALAQSGNATLSGSVTDATGAVIPSAKVTVTNTATAGPSRRLLPDSTWCPR